MYSKLKAGDGMQKKIFLSAPFIYYKNKYVVNDLYYK